MEPYAGKRFKIRVDFIGKKIKPKQIVQHIEALDLSALEPLNVDLKNAEHTFELVKDDSDTYHFGRVVAKTRLSKTKQFYQTPFNTDQRPYQAPTCLDHELSFIACNMAQIKENDFVYDPFVGSASTLISAAYIKAITFGSDLDARVVLGSGIGRKSYNTEVTQ